MVVVSNIPEVRGMPQPAPFPISGFFPAEAPDYEKGIPGTPGNTTLAILAIPFLLEQSEKSAISMLPHQHLRGIGILSPDPP
jgi:hypothetical protein